MPYTAHHLMIAWGGTLFGTEQWVNTLRMGFPNTVNAGDVAIYANTNFALIHSKIKTWYTANLPYWTTAGAFVWSKFNGIEASLGHYADPDSSNTTFESGAGVQGTGTPTQPPSVAVVGTWTTDATRGLVHSGKIYLPIIGLAPQSDGLMTAVNAGQVRDLLRDLANSFNTMPTHATGGAPKVSLLSKVRSGQTRRVTGVKVGRVHDTMRSRRRQLLETYTTTTAIT